MPFKSAVICHHQREFPDVFVLMQHGSTTQCGLTASARNANHHRSQSVTSDLNEDLRCKIVACHIRARPVIRFQARIRVITQQTTEVIT